MKLLRRLLFLIYCLSVFFIVFIGNDHRQSHSFISLHRVNLIPIKQKIDYITNGDIYAMGNWKFYLKEIMGNLLLLFPLPLFLLLGEGWTKVNKVVFLGFSISLGIELAQFFSGMGSADIDDLMLNTLGVIIGAYLSVWTKKRKFWSTIQSSFQLPS